MTKNPYIYSLQIAIKNPIKPITVFTRLKRSPQIKRRNLYLLKCFLVRSESTLKFFYLTLCAELRTRRKVAKAENFVIYK